MSTVRSTNPRRSSRLAAKATKQSVAEKPAVVVAVVNKPFSPISPNKEMVIRTIKSYLQSVELAVGTFTKVRVAIELFEFIDKHFEFINTQEFCENKRFVITIHDKTLSLEKEIAQEIEKGACSVDNAKFWNNEYIVYSKSMELIRRVHKKCHLYGMDKFVTSDPIYKNFLDTYMDKYLLNH
jgi:hypothetical protein